MKEWFKKTCWVVMFIVSISIGICVIIATASMNKNKAYDEAPTYEQVEEELEYWLVADYVNVERKEKVEDYVIYYVNCDRHDGYYAVVYKIKGGNYLSYHWEYSHHVQIGYSEFKGDK